MSGVDEMMSEGDDILMVEKSGDLDPVVDVVLKKSENASEDLTPLMAANQFEFPP